MQRLTKTLFLVSLTALLSSCGSGIKTFGHDLPTDKLMGAAVLSFSCKDIKDSKDKSIQLPIAKKPPLALHFNKTKMLNLPCYKPNTLSVLNFEPGTYRIGAWGYSQDSETKTRHLDRPFYFTIKNQTVTYLGHIKLGREEDEYHVQVTQNYETADLGKFKTQYPSLQALPLRKAAMR